MIIAHIITSLNDGGAEGVLYRLCSNDREHKHIVISLLDEGKYGLLLRKIGVDVYCLNINNKLLFFKSLLTLRKLLKRLKPDLVQTWMYHADFLGGVISRLVGIRKIYWGVRNSNITFKNSNLISISIFRINSILSNWIPEKIIYCSQKSKEIHELNGFMKSKGELIHNGYDFDKLIPSKNLREDFRIKNGIKSEVFLIGNVGRYNSDKDYKNLFSSLSKFEGSNNIQILLAGSNLDYDNKELIEIIKTHGLTKKVKLMGQIENISTIMNGIDLFVLSSSSESFPNVLSEAMACGSPCVTTNVGDASLIVGKTGWVVPPKDPNALEYAISHAIEEKASNSSKWAKRSKSCRNRVVENFDIQKMVSKYHLIWGVK